MEASRMVLQVSQRHPARDPTLTLGSKLPLLWTRYKDIKITFNDESHSCYEGMVGNSKLLVQCSRAVLSKFISNMLAQFSG